VRQIGGEGIVSKRRRSLYRGGESREWLKTKCSETGVFAITGFSELGDGKLDAVYVAVAGDGVLCPAGQVRFFHTGQGTAGRLARQNRLSRTRSGPL
jgi:ATP-dependent DNA ligase